MFNPYAQRHDDATLRAVEPDEATLRAVSEVRRELRPEAQQVDPAERERHPRERAEQDYEAKPETGAEVVESQDGQEGEAEQIAALSSDNSDASIFNLRGRLYESEGEWTSGEKSLVSSDNEDAEAEKHAVARWRMENCCKIH